jgi:hypothetical protein
MTPEQQQIAIAEVCGWTQCEYVASLNLAKGIPPINNSLKYGTYENGMAQLPDYLNDLNACHEMEQVLFCDKWKWLAYVNNLNEMPSLQDEWLCVSIHATAPQRAEAFLRTLGLWQETSTQPQ